MSSIPYEQKASAALERLELTTALAQLDTAAQQAAAEGWSYTHFLGYLLSGEIDERHRRTVALNLQFRRSNAWTSSTSPLSRASIAVSSTNSPPGDSSPKQGASSSWDRRESAKRILRSRLES